jgi:hypothetical protein
MKAIVKAALRVAEHYPVFPTNDKVPCWSNADLGVGRGEGGYKIASQNHDRVVELFKHSRALEIAVPMGAMSGLIAVDVDSYKNTPGITEWVEANREVLYATRSHSTRSGGTHFIFLHPGDDVRFPSTLREGVDLKAGGTGYICWPCTRGYHVLHDNPIQPFPMELLRAAMIAKGGTGSMSSSLGSFNSATDDELIKQIEEATEIYPALRSLAWRMPGRRRANGTYMTETEMVNVLELVMDTSVAADEGHPRHDDWLDRRGKIPELVSTAKEKEEGGVGLTDAEIAAVSRGESFMQTTQEIIAASSRPIGPQRQPTTADVEKRIEEMRASRNSTPKSGRIDTNDASDFVSLNVGGLRESRLPAIEYVIPQMLSVGGVCSLAGVSNVGKTRYMAALVVALAVGDTARLRLPQCTGRHSTLYVANEEHLADMARRFKAVALQHGDENSANIVVRGKAAGTFRLVVPNEAGKPEIDLDAIAVLADEIREEGVTVLALDPYVTLSSGGDENSADTASIVNSAFLMLIKMTGVSVIFPHHTPKDRSRDPDAFRGSADAWRGSGAIYSGLDYGFTLCNWYPRNKDQRKAWKAQYLSANLSRFVVLDCGKIREGEAPPEIIMELVPQDMDEGEGEAIGVVRVIDEATAMNTLLDGTIDVMINNELALSMINTIGEGTHTNMTRLHGMMKGHHLWPDSSKLEGKQRLLDMFGEVYRTTSGSVHVLRDAKGKWRVIIEENG